MSYWLLDSRAYGGLNNPNITPYYLTRRLRNKTYYGFTTQPTNPPTLPYITSFSQLRARECTRVAYAYVMFRGTSTTRFKPPKPVTIIPL